MAACRSASEDGWKIDAYNNFQDEAIPDPNFKFDRSELNLEFPVELPEGVSGRELG